MFQLPCQIPFLNLCVLMFQLPGINFIEGDKYHRYISLHNIMLLQLVIFLLPLSKDQFPNFFLVSYDYFLKFVHSLILAQCALPSIENLNQLHPSVENSRVHDSLSLYWYRNFEVNKIGLSYVYCRCFLSKSIYAQFIGKALITHLVNSCNNGYRYIQGNKFHSFRSGNLTSVHFNNNWLLFCLGHLQC